MPTPEEVAAIYRESLRHLRDEPHEPPHDEHPEPPPLEIKFESEAERWRREGTEYEQKRAAEKAKTRREEERTARAQARAVGDAASVEDRLAALEQRMDSVEEQLSSLANGAMGFSDAVTSKLREFETLTVKLEATLTTLRATHQRECKALRDKLVASEAQAARENATLARELTNARHEISRLDDRRERKQDREQLATLSDNVGNVVQLLREDIINRGGVA